MWLILRGQWVTIVIFVLQLTQIYWFFTKDQTILLVEQGNSEYEEPFPSCPESCLFSIRIVSEVQNFSDRAGVPQLSPVLRPGSHPSSFFPQTRRNVFLILHKVPHQQHRSTLLILWECDKGSANLTQM